MVINRAVILTFIEIMVTLLVFGVGLPFLIFERPAWLRRIRERQSRWVWVRSYIPFLVAAIIVLLVGYLVPKPSWLDCGTNTNFVFGKICAGRDYFRLHWIYTSSGLVILGIILMGLLWLRLHLFSYGYALRRLKGQTLRGLKWKKGFHNEKVEDMGELGLYTEIEGDRAAVVAAVSEVTQKLPIESMEESRLNDCMLSITKALRSTTSRAQETKTFKECIEILQYLLMEISKNYRDEVDQPQAVQTLLKCITRVGCQALRRESIDKRKITDELIACIDSAREKHRSGPYYELGLASLEEKNSQVGMLYFSKLAGLIDQFFPVDNDTTDCVDDFPSECISYYLGFLSRLCSLSISAKGHVFERFLNSFGSYGHQIDICFERGKASFLLDADYETVDSLVILEKEVENRRTQTYSEFVAITGVGEKSAQRLVGRYLTLEAARSATDEELDSLNIGVNVINSFRQSAFS